MSHPDAAIVTLAEKMQAAEKVRAAMVEMSSMEFTEEKSAETALAFLIDLKMAEERFQHTLMKALVKTIDAAAGVNVDQLQQAMREHPELMEDYKGIAMDPASGEMALLSQDDEIVPLSETPLADALTPIDQIPGLADIEGIDLSQTIEPERTLRLDPPPDAG